MLGSKELNDILEDYSDLIGVTNNELAGTLGSSPSAVAKHRKEPNSSPLTKDKATALVDYLDKRQRDWAAEREDRMPDVARAVMAYLDQHLDRLEEAIR